MDLSPTLGANPNHHDFKTNWWHQARGVQVAVKQLLAIVRENRPIWESTVPDGLLSQFLEHQPRFSGVFLYRLDISPTSATRHAFRLM